MDPLADNWNRFKIFGGDECRYCCLETDGALHTIFQRSRFSEMREKSGIQDQINGLHLTDSNSKKFHDL